MRTKVLTLIMTIVIGLAGCVDDPPATNDGASRPVSGTNGSDAVVPTPGPPTDGGVGATAVVEPSSASFYFTESRGITLDMPGEGFVVIGETFPDYRYFVGTVPFRPFIGDGMIGSWIVTSATVELFFSSEQELRESGSTFGFRPVNLWMGVDHPGSPRTGLDAPATVPPGTVAAVTGELALPPGGLVFESGTAPHLNMFFAYAATEQAPLRLHVGGETPSRLTLTGVPYIARPVKVVSEESYPGTFTFATPFADHPDQSEVIRDFPITVTPTLEELEVTLVGRSASANTDMDLIVLDTSGNPIWASASPSSTESLALFSHNFARSGFGTYTLRVHNFQAIQGEFTLTVRHLEVAPSE